MTDIESRIKSIPWSVERRIPTKAGVRVVCDTPMTPELQVLASDRALMRRFGLTVSAFKGEVKLSRWRSLNAAEVQEINNLIAESCAMDADIQIPVAIGKEYMAFQRAGIAFALKRQNTLIADEPGLGKTIQCIGVINALPEIKRVLVVPPASLKINWLREINGWLARTMSAGLANGKKWTNADIVIINYENVDKHRDKIMAVDWDLLVVDEAHVLKNPETKRAKAVLGYRPPHTKAKKMLEAIIGGAVSNEMLADKYETLCTAPIKAKRKIFLTGTPIANRPKELFAIINALAPEVFPDFMAYARRHCGARKFTIKGKTAWDFSGAEHLEELQLKLRTSCMIRRRKADVLTELPPKIRRIVELPAEGLGLADLLKSGGPLLEKAWAKRDELDALKSRASASDNPAAFEQAIKALTYSADTAFEEMSAMRRLLAEKKLPLVIQRLREEMEDNPEHKMIVFAHHRNILESLQKEFADCSVMILGGMTEKKKDAAVQAFQNDPKAQLFFGQIEAAGVGLTLTASSHVIMVEDHWVPGMVSQAEDRCVLKGQKVLTATGWRPIEDICVGDLVLSHDGLLHKVTDAWSRRAKGARRADCKMIVEIETRGWNEKICVTHDHQVLTGRGWLQAVELRPGDKILMPSKIDGGSTTSVDITDDIRISSHFETEEIVRSNGRPKPACSQRNGRLVTLPESINLDEDAMFTFGYYLGDGFSSVGDDKGRFVSFSGHKTQKLTYLQRCADWVGKLGINSSVYPGSDGGDGVELRAFSGELARFFAVQFGRILDEKRIAEWVFSTPNHLREAFLDGVAASDGHARPTRDRTEIVTASERLAADICRLMMSLGLKPCVHRGSPASGRHLIVNYTNGTAPVLCVSEVLIRSGRNRDRVYDITVDGASSFVVGTGVVHNCHRKGQRDSVFVEHLVIEGSIDVKIVKDCIAKQEIIDRSLDGPRFMPPPKTEPPQPLSSTSKDEAFLSTEQIFAIHEGLRSIAAGCDGALAHDGQGFSGVDTYIGRSLASTTSLSQKQALLGLRLCRKYRRQVPEHLHDRLFSGQPQAASVAA